MTRSRRIGGYLAAPMLCLVLYWRTPFIWFRVDDFNWLSLPEYSWRALLRPMAQGTVRVISERLYFLTLTKLFGMEAWPFHVTAFAVWCLVLTLMQLVATRLTGSRAAGWLAAMLWTMSPALVEPLVWPSAFNQPLIALVFLGAFYSRLRGWRVAEIALYLAGFGVLEIIVVYPAVVLLYSLIYERRLRFDLWLVVPAVLFSAAHVLLIHNRGGPAYTLFFDLRMLPTLWLYTEWASGWGHLGANGLSWFVLRCASWAAIAGLGLFVFFRVRAKDYRPLFFLGWFVLVLAPVLPLVNHIMKYYLTTAGIGLALLAGWALVTAWDHGLKGRIGCVVLASVYTVASVLAIQKQTGRFAQMTSEIRIAVEGVRSLTQTHPHTAVALTGIRYETFMQSALHRPYEMVGASKVWLLPGSFEIPDRTEWGVDLSHFRISGKDLLGEVIAGKARILDVSPPLAHDATATWLATQGGREYPMTLGPTTR